MAVTWKKISAEAIAWDSMNLYEGKGIHRRSSKRQLWGFRFPVVERRTQFLLQKVLYHSRETTLLSETGNIKTVLPCADITVRMPFEYLNSTLPCQRIQNASRLIEGPTGIERSIEMHEAMIIILGTGFLAFFVAWGFTAIRKHVYKDEVSHVACVRFLKYRLSVF